MTTRVTNSALLDAVMEVKGEVVDLRVHVAEQNGAINAAATQAAQNRAALKSLPCGTMLTEVALLKKESGRQGKNWERVINIALALVQAGAIIYLTQLVQRLQATAAALQQLP